MKRAVQQRPNVIKVDDAIKTTISEIMAEARNGKWRVYGYDEEAKKKVTLSEADLTGQPSLAGVAAHRIGRYKDVKFERIVEPSEEAPAAVAEQAAAIQDARKLVHEWYVDGWVPACGEAGFIPSRDDDDPKAAKRVFGDKIDGLRDILRDAREEHAPKPWRSPGPKRLNRKNAHSDPDYPKRLDRLVARSIELWRGADRDTARIEILANSGGQNARIDRASAHSFLLVLIGRQRPTQDEDHPCQRPGLARSRRSLC